MTEANRISIESMSPAIIFSHLTRILQEQNSCQLMIMDEDFKHAEVPIKIFQEYGFFFDNPHDLNHSFWKFMASEETELLQYFENVPDEALMSLMGVIFSDIFKRSINLSCQR